MVIGSGDLSATTISQEVYDNRPPRKPDVPINAEPICGKSANWNDCGGGLRKKRQLLPPMAIKKLEPVKEESRYSKGRRAESFGQHHGKRREGHRGNHHGKQQAHEMKKKHDKVTKLHKGHDGKRVGGRKHAGRKHGKKHGEKRAGKHEEMRHGHHKKGHGKHHKKGQHVKGWRHAREERAVQETNAQAPVVKETTPTKKKAAKRGKKAVKKSARKAVKKVKNPAKKASKKSARKAKVAAKKLKIS